MGKIADWMLEGGLCQACGVYVGASVGYPQTCAGCQTVDVTAVERPINLVPCVHKGCKKQFKTEAAATQHYKDKHKTNGEKIAMPPIKTEHVEKQIFRSLALAHPLEMYTAFPERFWEVFQELRPNCNREHMVLELERIGLPHQP